MGRRVVCGREPPEGVARVEVFFSSGACRAFGPRGWKVEVRVSWHPNVGGGQIRFVLRSICAVFTPREGASLFVSVGGCVLSLAIARGLHLRTGCILLGLASPSPLPRVLPKRFTRVHISNSPAAFLHHPVSVGCMSERQGRI